MRRKVLFALLGLLGFLSVLFVQQIIEDSKVSKVYELLEKNVVLLEAERYSPDKIRNIHENGVNAISAVEFKNEIVQTIRQQFQTELTGDQLTMRFDDTFIEISYTLNDNIRCLHRYTLEGEIIKFATVEKYNKFFSVRNIDDGNRIVRSLEIDKEAMSQGIRFVLYSSGGALIFIILGILSVSKKQYMIYITKEEVNIKEFNQTKGRLHIKIRNWVILVIIILLPMFAVSYYFRLHYDTRFIPDRIENILMDHSYIFDEERIPVEMIINAINDYTDEFNIQPDQKLEYTYTELQEQRLSGNLNTLIDTFMGIENQLLDSKLTMNHISNITIDADQIGLYFFWEDVSYNFSYYKDGYINKTLNLWKDIHYRILNANNTYMDLEKQYATYSAYRLYMRVSIWVCAYVCFAFGIYNSVRKKPIRLWNNKQSKYIELYDYHKSMSKIYLMAYGAFLLMIGYFAHDMGFKVTIILCCIVVGLAYTEYFYKRHYL
ncbi:MAG: hypothetical protein K0S76_2624 [Herbinix sp.]|jgi:hypothetical protein|nr:hypothetical protein [Herbinix sp.]